MCKLLLLSAIFFSAMVHAQAQDPTRPLGQAGVVSGAALSEREGLQLTSILISADRKLAIINGQTLQENQTIAGVGAQVKKIDADAVTLQQGNRIWRLSLYKTNIRQ